MKKLTSKALAEMGDFTFTKLVEEGYEVAPEGMNESILENLRINFGIKTREDILDRYEDICKHVAEVAYETDLLEMIGYEEYLEDLPKIKLDGRIKRSLGLFRPAGFTIVINRDHYTNSSLLSVLSTVLHEVSHSVLYNSGNDFRDFTNPFEYLLRKLGASSSGRNKVNVSMNYYITYNGCTFRRHRRMNLDRKPYCTCCNGPITYVGKMTEEEFKNGGDWVAKIKPEGPLK